MATIHPESPEDFEFIKTPAASCITPAEDCGVRTTKVSLDDLHGFSVNWFSQLDCTRGKIYENMKIKKIKIKTMVKIEGKAKEKKENMTP